jgi:hypothetical protein
LSSHMNFLGVGNTWQFEWAKTNVMIGAFT